MTLKPGRLFIAESFNLNILSSPLQELFPNKMQPPSPIKTCTCITGQIPAWGRDSADLCRAQTATPLHHCKSCGNVLVCWWCPAPQAGTYLDPVMQWVVHCWEEWKGSRAVLLLALRRAQGVESSGSWSTSIKRPHCVPEQKKKITKTLQINLNQIWVNPAWDWLCLVLYPSGKWCAPQLRNALLLAALSMQWSHIIPSVHNQPQEVPHLHNNQSPPVLQCHCCEVSTALNKKSNLAHHDLNIQRVNNPHSFIWHSSFLHRSPLPLGFLFT